MQDSEGSLFVGRLVRLAAPRLEDAEALARWSEDANLLRLMDSEIARPQTKEEIEQIIKNLPRERASKVAFHVRALADDRLIGRVNLRDIEWNNGSAILGIDIGVPEYRGKGYGAEILRLILRYAFTELNLYRVGLDVLADNVRAVRAYERTGFRHEGVCRGAVLRDGRRSDVLLMGILRDEWLQMQGAAPKLQTA